MHLSRFVSGWPSALLLAAITVASSVDAASKQTSPGQKLHAPAGAAAPANVNLLIKAGALKLAIQVVDREQDDRLMDSKWQSWEKLRYRLYFKRRDWSSLAKRYESYPESLPDSSRNWATEQLARSLLMQGNSVLARTYLRQLIWSSAVDDKKRIARWRRLLIESYLGDKRIQDADRALILYQADYPGRSDSWQILRAKVLLQQNRYRDGFDVLAGMQRMEPRLLRLYAALEAGIYQPAVVIKSARRITNLKYANAAVRKKSWVLISKAARKSRNSSTEIVALEQALHIRHEDVVVDPLFGVRPDDLWTAYEKYSEALGNRKRLLIGDDAAWMRQAEIIEKKTPAEARAVYAFLSRKGSAEIIREISHKRLTDSLYKQKLGTTAVALYTRGTMAGPVDQLPDVVRYRLAIEILRNGDIKLAANIMKSLKQPPAEESVRDWKLRRARTMVYAGQFNEATRLLQQIVKADPEFKKEFVRRFIQVVFDLQAVGEHDAALDLFGGIYQKTGEQEIQRELLFWMAESNVASGNNTDAAGLYLRSAFHGQPKGGDMWGQSARYHAAESLARAGYNDDARVVYEKLLRHTPDAKRRAIIERNLQQLWLKKQTTRTQ